MGAMDVFGQVSAKESAAGQSLGKAAMEKTEQRHSVRFKNRWSVVCGLSLGGCHFQKADC
jgi:hypothetical protein